MATSDGRLAGIPRRRSLFTLWRDTKEYLKYLGDIKDKEDAPHDSNIQECAVALSFSFVIIALIIAAML